VRNGIRQGQVVISITDAPAVAVQCSAVLARSLGQEQEIDLIPMMFLPYLLFSTWLEMVSGISMASANEGR
jgi:hypothetical protein